MIRYTGNPYVDAGVAVLELRLKKPAQEFTVGDLETEANGLEVEYGKKIWKGYLTVHFTSNSGWTNPTTGEEKRKAYRDLVLRGFRRSFLASQRTCAYCGRPTQALVDRTHMPLLTGETVMMAGAEGVPGLPVCGYCLFAAQFYPLATLKVDGRPLFWWAPEPAWIRRLTARFHNEIG